jgi:hypothetical protein
MRRARSIARLFAAVVVTGVCWVSTAWAQTAESPVKLTPYGTIYFNLFDNSDGVNNADVPLWATPGLGSVSASARQTRFGLRVTGLTVGNAKVTGVLEADFYGGFPSVGVGDNMGVVRLRLANVRLDWQSTSLVIGQDWMVFAPANPTSLASAGIPLMAATGNAWSRLPQVRLEWHKGPVLLQGALLAPSTGDFSSAFADTPQSGPLSQVPFFQGRAAFTSKDWMGGKRPASIGLSGHYGRARVVATSSDKTIDSRGVAADWSVPIATRFSLTGEAFTGQNLAAFQAGVFQGVNPDFNAGSVAAPVNDAAHSISTRGGWAQLTATVNSALNILATYGLDDPRDDSLFSVSKHDWRVRNQATAIGFIHKLSPQLSWGIEDRRIVTQSLVAGRRTANHVNFAATFTF